MVSARSIILWTAILTPVAAFGVVGPQTKSASSATALFASRQQQPRALSKGLKDAHNWDQDLVPVTVQGGALKTWSFQREDVERVQVVMKTDGRPLNANVELWHTPNNKPQTMKVYIEDGCLRPFSAVMETPLGVSAVAIYNTGNLEFPLTGALYPELVSKSAGGQPQSGGLGYVTRRLAATSNKKDMQGGSVHTVPFDPSVKSVQVLLKTVGRPLHARIELMQGPNNDKQTIDVYSEDGQLRPFFAVFETPGSGNVVRIINTGTVEFPLTACVEPYQTNEADKYPKNIFQVS